ncbi:putative porin [Mesonia ostreae]|uniref:Porin n=1 Tax=Mesonia ostreae TaxID=861110 RepID=A0ABU2KGZ2_9FLAO|nr:putative porin [Mesonia ostreae]MDT0293980.1 putative porin [Mesonia ostreae]
MKKILFLLLLLLPVIVLAQDLRLNNDGTTSNAPIGDNKTVIDKREKPPITDYKIISVENDTTYVDTTLNVYKDYKFNYTRKDNFELLPFSNIGQPFTKLGYSLEDDGLVPDIGASAKQFPYLKVGDIFYYNVPTPLSELFFKTTFQQGQNLDAFFTSNISPQVNLFIGYRGLRSLGNYQHNLTSQGSFRIGGSFHTKNKRYHIKTHFVSQDLSTEENGGLNGLANLQYQSEADDFSERNLLEVNFENAESILFAKRFFLKQDYALIAPKDSLSSNFVKLEHTLNFTDKEYHYKQGAAFVGFGEAFELSQLRDEAEYQNVSNTLKGIYENKKLGRLSARATHYNINYGYQTKLILNTGVIPNRIMEDVFSAGAAYKNRFGGFDLYGNIEANISGAYTGSNLYGEAGYSLDEENRLSGSIQSTSRTPDFNFLLFQSDYVNYNWSNDFKNIEEQKIKISLKSKKLLNAEVLFAQINNYTHFGFTENPDTESAADTLVKPIQSNQKVDYLKLKVNKVFSYGNFKLDNTLMYQNVSSGKEVFKTPDFVTRNTLLYEDHLFKRALFFQTGLTFNYFTKFSPNAYDPILGDYVVQNAFELENQYRVDFFFNAKIQQTRIFFKLENMTTLLTGNSYYAAPSYPYRDFVIRFGLVWNFFL